MDFYAAALQIGRMRQGQHIFQVLFADVPVAPVGNLHLAVRPLRRILPDQVLQVLFFISPDNGFLRDCPERTDAFIRPGTADAVISREQEMVNALPHGVFHYGAQRGIIPVDV